MKNKNKQIPAFFTECFEFQWVGDDKCEDFLNHPVCEFDGGDCCSPTSDKTYCIDCLCLDESTYTTSLPYWHKATTERDGNVNQSILYQISTKLLDLTNFFQNVGNGLNPIPILAMEFVMMISIIWFVIMTKVIVVLVSKAYFVPTVNVRTKIPITLL